MKKRHAYYQLMLPRYPYGELTASERGILEEHLQTCKQCRSDLESIQQLHALLEKVPPVEVEDAVLSEARMQLRVALNREEWKPRLLEKVRSTLFLPLVYRPAVAGAALMLFVLGFFAARVAGPAGFVGSGDGFALSEGAHITNVQFVRGSGVSSDIELVFDTVKPVRLRGTVDDPTIRRVLAYALMNEENPGIRLRTAGVVGGLPGGPAEPEVKAALLFALRCDPNDGVRKEALKAILRFPPDKETRDALLQVLLHDKNAGMRVAAVSALDTMRTRGLKPDQRMQEMLRDCMEHDNNLFVRVKSRTLLEENYQ
jgi:hypothetical protein